MIIAKFKNWVKDYFDKTMIYFDQIQISHYFDCMLISIIVAIAFFSFGPGLDSSWGIIDDHEIMNFSPAYHPMGFSEIIPTLLTKTEINPNSTDARFRPAFYFLRLIETRIWSVKAPFLWYLTRIGIYIFFIIVIFYFFKRFNGRIVGGLLTLLIATFDFWSGILSRLGPAETYAILGLSLLLIGTLILNRKLNSNFAWFLIMLGTVIAIGSKENMFVFLVPEVYLAVVFLRKPLKNNLFPFIMIALSIFWEVWIFTTVLLRIKANGSDYYGNSVGLIGRLSILVGFISQNILLDLIIGSLLIVGIIGFLITKNKILKPHFANLVFGTLGIVILISSQQIFYSGLIWERYNFPYALYLPFTISLVANFLQNLPFFTNKYFYPLFSLAIGMVMIIFFIHPSNIMLLRKNSYEYDSATHQFEATLHDIEYYLSTNTSSSIVFYGNKPEDDYERILSVIRYVRSDAYSNAIFVYTNPPLDYETTFSKLNVSLEKQLLQWSQNGKTDERISPMIDYFENPKDCLLIIFSNIHPAKISCNSVINIQ
jgi:hypothetical protein